jgi:hypothetical protein
LGIPMNEYSMFWDLHLLDMILWHFVIVVQSDDDTEAGSLSWAQRTGCIGMYPIFSVCRMSECPPTFKQTCRIL